MPGSMFNSTGPPSSIRASSQVHTSLSPLPNGFNKRKFSNMMDDVPPGPGPPNKRQDTLDNTADDSRVIAFRNAYNSADKALESVLLGRFEPLSLSDDIVAPEPPSIKRSARTIDEDDYGDDGDEDEEDDEPPKPLTSPLLRKTSASNFAVSSPWSNGISPQKPALGKRHSQALDSNKAPEDARKKIQENKKALEQAAQSRFHNMFYTLENDRTAMLEQQRVDELDRQVEAEMSADQRNVPNNAATNGASQGSLSSANLGASSLMLKHLLSRIDAKRNLVKAHDWQLRKLISEVRKNRSKWASEDKVGQEELYEAAEKVLGDLKAMTEYSGPFLNRVNKREAPDYYNIIKQPMDIGTMMKKLKSLSYKSKKEFCDDLNLIWTNCLSYNTDPNHPLRKKALHLQKHSEQMVFLIPDIVIQDRAEYEAEQRRQHMDAELDGLEDSDDEPIIASRGRKAPSKGAQKGSTARKAPTANEEAFTPDVRMNLSTPGLRHGSDLNFDAMMNGFGTPPPLLGGNLTPITMNGIIASGASQADHSEMDINGFQNHDLNHADEPEYADLDQETWKQVTKKARANAAMDRNRLFINGRLNPEEPAILRSKAAMRRFVRLQRKFSQSPIEVEDSSSELKDDRSTTLSGETLTEGVEAAEDDYILPDYYDPVSSIPEINKRLRWELDNEGEVLSHADECLRVVPRGYFTSPDSTFNKKMQSNMRQMQETRRICGKIGVVKQMQLQTQVYQNQFPKYDAIPFYEHDIESHVVSDDGPVMTPEICRAAFQRSIAKICYHAGFEDFQPAALDSFTDIVGSFFQKLISDYEGYSTMPQMTINSRGESTIKPRYCPEEALAHTLDQNSIDVEGLDYYVKDDAERLGIKLGVMHERMKSHLADLLRPALDANAGTDGVGAFNDGSEQFVGGDFAIDIDEDFFGFRELGLDKEFSMASLNVPFHLLQNRMHSTYQSTNTNANSGDEVLPQPENFDSVTADTLTHEIGIAQAWFLNRLGSSATDGSLIEDDDLPPKQRFPKPRLPPSGKITSPRKRPIREQQQMAKKKRKLEESGKLLGSNGLAEVNGLRGKDIPKINLQPPNNGEIIGDPEKDGGDRTAGTEEGTGMMSPPESL